MNETKKNLLMAHFCPCHLPRWVMWHWRCELQLGNKALKVSTWRWKWVEVDDVVLKHEMWPQKCGAEDLEGWRERVVETRFRRCQRENGGWRGQWHRKRLENGVQLKGTCSGDKVQEVLVWKWWVTWTVAPKTAWKWSTVKGNTQWRRFRRGRHKNGGRWMTWHQHNHRWCSHLWLSLRWGSW